MDDLDDLYAQLQSAFVAKSKTKLSDRNCVELVIKLQDLGLVKLLHTQDGKEYLTPERLDKEVRDEILLSGGRIAVQDIPEQINVDIQYVEKAVHRLVAEDPQLRLLNNEVISEQYFETAAADINEILQMQGRVEIGELAKRLSLPADLVRKMVKSTLGTIIQGTLERGDDVLYTSSFVRRLRAQALGAMTAITRPTALATLQKKYNLQADLFYSVVEKLAAKGLLPGKLQGKGERATYTPQVYVARRDRWIDTFFTQNQFIEYRALAKVQITDGATFLKSHYGPKKGLALKTCFISNQVVSQLDAALQAAAEEETWKDVRSDLPLSLDAEDMALVLQKCPALTKNKGAMVVVSDWYVVSQALVAKSQKALEAHIKAMGASGELPPLPVDAGASSSAAGGDDGDDDDDDGGGRKKGKKGKKGGKGGGKASKGGGGGGGGKGKKGSGGGSDFALPAKVLHKMVAESLGADAGDDEELLAAVASEYLAPAVHRLYVAAAGELAQKGPGGDFNKRAVLSQLQDEFTAVFANVQHFGTAAETLPEPEPRTMVVRHVLKTLGTELAVCLLRMQCVHVGAPMEAEALATFEQRTAAIKKLPKGAAATFQALMGTLSKSSVADLLAAVDDAAELCELHYKALDKKRERQLVYGHRLTLLKQLQDCESAPELLHGAVVLAHHAVHGVILHIPGRAVAAVLDALKVAEGADTDMVQLLGGLQKEVVAMLGKKKGGDDGAEPSEPSDAAIEAMGKIKARLAASKK